jgi:hypothetical protein
MQQPRTPCTAPSAAVQWPRRERQRQQHATAHLQLLAQLLDRADGVAERVKPNARTLGQHLHQPLIDLCERVCVCVLGVCVCFVCVCVLLAFANKQSVWQQQGDAQGVREGGATLTQHKHTHTHMHTYARHTTYAHTQSQPRMRPPLGTCRCRPS